MLQVQLRCLFCLLLKGSPMYLHLFGRLPSLPRCLHGESSLRTLRGTRGADAHYAPSCPVSPHTATFSSRLGGQGEAGVGLVPPVSALALLYLGFSSFCSFAWAAVGTEAAARAVGGLRCAG